MTELLTAAQMRAIEQAAIESGAVTGLELMERAGRGVVEAIFEEWPELARVERGASPSCSPGYLEPEETGKVFRAVVLCGPGNNGGDGFVVARLLKERGWEVEVFLYGDASRLPPDARVNYERWAELGAVTPWDEGRIAERDGDLFVDAVFGAGLTRSPEDKVLRPLDSLYVRGATFGKMVAIDAPSGLCMDSGVALSANYGAVRAFLTVTFHKARIGHFCGDGETYCTKLAVKDIGLETSSPRCEQAGIGKVKLQDRPSGLGKLGDGHKYAHGHAMILSGPSGKGGAARLAARGALRIGAGLVTVAPTPGALQENAARLDAIMLSPVGDAQALEAVLADARLNALCLGPGLGQERARDLVPVALAAGRATVLDADALTAYADAPQELFDMLHGNCVLTPHAGEFARLFPDIAEKLNAPATKGPAYSKVDATREAAARAGCVVLFKGPDTVIADPDGTCAVNPAAYERSAPWLATAGSGDVLAGFMTGLLARGFAPKPAAEQAASLHVECALTFGPGLIAEDLPEMLPRVYRGLGG
ncbi:bifunctional NAD(P)H-hydrate repair enzyme [Aliiroseovarius zhejiangensis]|uniref:Bifunctional NAD(P)H-hydrate repair enzyme n=1 Tax=Aliiroseovarius zhejiangensis TaxID=1632025 RepID=A0ABQ3IKH3_9RHOB|nr:NAD(P)H-hydrate dehydratase [Aliiroseovarius zhejiangensis]GHE86552.1 bifunctional NAD(P)H-hydrate repair enzyme [Aliiroseovarius zhejiangensis]